MRNEFNVLIDFFQGLTIGGLITLRMESELIINNSNYNFVKIFLKGNYNLEQKKMIDDCFKISLLNFDIYDFQDNISIHWPKKIDFNANNFSYHSTLRVQKLSKKYKMFPMISWKPNFIKKIEDKINIINLKTSLILHLKNQKGGLLEESNVDVAQWDIFFKKIIKKYPKLSFILIGNDVPLELLENKNTYCSEDFDLNLFEELAISSISKGFLGLASGMSSATIFSKNSYVIIKHPEHHKIEMNIELGNKDRLPFAKNNQKILRIKQNANNLTEALSVLL